MKTILILISLFLIINEQLYSQSNNYPYKLELRKDLIITGISALSFFSENLVGAADHNDNPAYFDNLNKNHINSIDRFATNNWNPDLDVLRENLSVGGFLGGLLIAGGITAAVSLNTNSNESTGKNLLTTGVMFFEGGFFVIGTFELSKVLIKRPRPYAYNPNVTYLDKIAEGDYKESFFSGSTTMAAYGTFFTAKFVNDIFPESDWKYLGWGAATIYSGYTGWMAVKAGHHFPTDVITGFIVGAGTAILMPELHKINNNPETSLSISPAINGLRVSFNF